MEPAERTGPAHRRRRQQGHWSDTRRRRALRSGVLLVVVVAVVVTVVALTGGSSPGVHRTLSTTRGSHPTTKSTSGSGGDGNRTLADHLGPVGVVSPAMLAENRKPGTTAWKILGASPPGYVVGFAGTTDAAKGDVVSLYVSTTASSFHVVAFRMGWYGGDGGRQIWSSADEHGMVQPACPLDTTVNMVHCDHWSRSLPMAVTQAFVPGEYLLLLVGSGGQKSYIPLTISDPSSHATYLLVSRSLTEEGWNTYGGYDFYEGQGPCILDTDTYPPCNRARVVSFDRPYATGEGASDFLGDEFPLVQYMERNGLDATYCTDVTVDEHPAMLLAHRAVFSLAHDETWTYPELQGAKAALAHGVNIAFMSSAAMVRHARLQSSSLGPDREVVEFRNSAEDPLNGRGSPWLVTGNTWDAPPTDFSVSTVTGELYSGYLEPGAPASALVVWDASAWIWRGTGLRDGSSVPGVIESDIDHLDPGGPMPSDIQVLGHSPVPLTDAYTNQGTWNGDTYSDMTYYVDPTSHAGVFDSGTVSWISSLEACPSTATSCPSTVVGAMTGNLLWLFGRGPAGDFVASTPNWRQVTPTGS